MGNGLLKKKARAVFLSGKRIELCVLEPGDDFSAYESWINDQETTKYLLAGKYPLTQEGIRQYLKQFKSGQDILLGIFIKKGRQHIGNIALRGIDQRNRNADVGLMIGEKNARGQGFGTEALDLIIGHAFFSLNLTRVMAGIVESNVPSIRLFEHLGFKKEGMLRQYFYLNGRYENFFLYGLLRSQYKKGETR